ncbi:hypothetical protein H0H93_002790 [Arthromyces matolae]|nr:hypothetical protein H0H93_002790 [Arthromyces matolae]
MSVPPSGSVSAIGQWPRLHWNGITLRQRIELAFFFDDFDLEGMRRCQIDGGV